MYIAFRVLLIIVTFACSIHCQGGGGGKGGGGIDLISRCSHCITIG